MSQRENVIDEVLTEAAEVEERITRDNRHFRLEVFGAHMLGVALRNHFRRFPFLPPGSRDSWRRGIWTRG